MTKVLILGSSGMLGSSMRKVFEQSPSLESFTASRGKDNPDFRISSMNDISDIISSLKPDFIVNCIGTIKPNIDELNTVSIRNAIEVNSVLPFFLSEESLKFNSRVIQIATDCVFDGKQGRYNEDVQHNPTDIYGKTKSLGEPSFQNFLNLRCSIVGVESFTNKSLLNWFLAQNPESEINGFTNHFWNGVTTDVFAEIVSGILINGNWIHGTYHLVPSNSVTKFELLNLFKKFFSRDDLFIRPIESSVSVDRTLSTKFTEINKIFWSYSRFKNSIPTIDELITTLNR
jgi:dTDP-4-dehydrorhamnose reductase